MISVSPEASLGRKAVMLLGATQIVGFGTIYYPFGILAESIGRDMGWTSSHFIGVFCVALGLSGLVTPFVGRAFDRLGAPTLMVSGSAMCAAMLAVMAAAPNGVVFTIAMVALQLVSNLVLYDAAFTSLVQIAPAQGERRIALLTLIAGFASTVFWPVTSWLLGALDWRGTLAVFAALNLGVCMVAHGFLRRWVRHARRQEAESHVPHRQVSATVRPEDRQKAFVLVALGFALSSIALSAVLALMVPMLIGLGHQDHALLVSMLFGPAQVVVRFTNLVFGAKRHPLFITILALSLLPLGILIGAVAGTSFLAGALFAVLVGMCSGLKSIVQGALPLRLFGSEGYGARQGLMSSFRYVASAAAPFGYSIGADLWGPRAACIVLAAIAVSGVACMILLASMLGPSLADSGATTEPDTGTDNDRNSNRQQ